MMRGREDAAAEVRRHAASWEEGAASHGYREAGAIRLCHRAVFALPPPSGASALDEIVARAVAAEREACAQVALEREEDSDDGHSWAAWPDGDEIAAAIRARSQGEVTE